MDARSTRFGVLFLWSRAEPDQATVRAYLSSLSRNPPVIWIWKGQEPMGLLGPIALGVAKAPHSRCWESIRAAVIHSPDSLVGQRFR